MEQKMIWWRTCADAWFLQFYEGELEEDAVVAEERYSWPSGVPAAYSYSSG